MQYYYTIKHKLSVQLQEIFFGEHVGTLPYTGLNHHYCVLVE